MLLTPARPLPPLPTWPVCMACTIVCRLCGLADNALMLNAPSVSAASSTCARVPMRSSASLAGYDRVRNPSACSRSSSTGFCSTICTIPPIISQHVISPNSIPNILRCLYGGTHLGSETSTEQVIGLTRRNIAYLHWRRLPPCLVGWADLAPRGRRITRVKHAGTVRWVHQRQNLREGFGELVWDANVDALGVDERVVCVRVVAPEHQVCCVNEENTLPRGRTGLLPRLPRFSSSSCWGRCGDCVHATWREERCGGGVRATWRDAGGVRVCAPCGRTTRGRALPAECTTLKRCPGAPG